MGFEPMTLGYFAVFEFLQRNKPTAIPCHTTRPYPPKNSDYDCIELNYGPFDPQGGRNLEKSGK